MSKRKSKGGALPSGMEIKANIPGSTEGAYVGPVDPVVAPAEDSVTTYPAAATPEQNYDGLITNAVVYENMIHGNMYDDRKKRFPDGKHIRTSAIMEYREDGLVQTKNSLYKVEWTQAQLDAFAAKKEL